MNPRSNIKFFSRFHAVILVALLQATAARAQFLGLGASGSPGSVAIGEPVTYTITITNLTANQIPGVFVTNALSGPYIVVDYAPTNSLFAAGSNLVFSLGPLLGLNIRQMSLTLSPLTGGLFTNTITAGSTSFAPVVTNMVVTLVTNLPATPADLAVSLTGPAGPVLASDIFTYGVTVSNAGTNTVSNVVLTNRTSTNLFLIAFAPTNPLPAIDTNGFLLFAVGTLTNGAARNYSITVLRTNAGSLSLTLFASVNSPNFTDVNTNNNFASTNISIEALVTNQLIATNLSAMTFNPQDSLMQQTVRLVNVSTSTVASARVIVKGLTNRLFNAVGTNTLGSTNLNPFVVYPAPLDPGQSADLVLQYVIPNRQPIIVTNYVAVPTSAVDLSVPALPSIALTNFFLPDGSMLVQFAATTGRTYQIQYSSDVTFNTNVLLAQPPIVAQANIVQWIDNGPPTTVSPPMSVPMRFYRVQLSP